MKVKCNEIKIGERVRKDLGDINELADSIKKIGLLQPIGVTKDNELVFGERRLSACKTLEHKEIEVVVIDSDDLFDCENSENFDRKSFNMSERVAVRKVYKERFLQENVEMVKKGIKVSNRHHNKTRDRLAKLTHVGQDKAKKEDFIVAFKDQIIIDQVDNNELSVNKAYNLIKQRCRFDTTTRLMKKETDTNNNNEVNVLPAEEIVEVEVEEPEVDNNIYTITISDTSDSLELSEDISNKIKHYSKTVEMSPLNYIESVFNEMFKDYTI